MTDNQVCLLVVLSGVMLIASLALSTVALFISHKGLKDYMDSRFSHIDSLLAKSKSLGRELVKAR